MAEEAKGTGMESSKGVQGGVDHKASALNQYDTCVILGNNLNSEQRVKKTTICGSKKL